MNAFTNEIQRALSDVCVCEAYETVNSTNTAARRLLLEGKRPPFACVSECQTGGRGRQGKSFFSTGGLYLTVALPPACATGEVSVTAYAACAVCRAVLQIFSCQCGIKWVNDLYYEGKKVCGILSEAVRDPESGALLSVIVGVGVNLDVQFPAELQDRAGNLPHSDTDLRAPLAREIVRQLLLYDPADCAFMAEYRACSMVIGRNITFRVSGVVKHGCVTAVQDDGSLTVQLPDGSTEKLSSGEITLRLVEPR